MSRILITAFEPYDDWSDNSSWLTLVELMRWLETSATVVTRRYPVDFQQVRERLASDLTEETDLVLHLGQAPGATALELEAIAVNVDQQGRELVSGAPTGYRSELPLQTWAERMNSREIPARVSYHAGTYLCNAIFYLSMHYAEEAGRPRKSVFIHLPVAPAQAAARPQPIPSVSVPLMAAGVAAVLEDYS